VPRAGSFRRHARDPAVFIEDRNTRPTSIDSSLKVIFDIAGGEGTRVEGETCDVA
jgi:hypothetical protein